MKRHVTSSLLAVTALASCSAQNSLSGVTRSFRPCASSAANVSALAAVDCTRNLSLHVGGSPVAASFSSDLCVSARARRRWGARERERAHGRAGRDAGRATHCTCPGTIMMLISEVAPGSSSPWFGRTRYRSGLFVFTCDERTTRQRAPREHAPRGAESKCTLYTPKVSFVGFLMVSVAWLGALVFRDRVNDRLLPSRLFVRRSTLRLMAAARSLAASSAKLPERACFLAQRTLFSRAAASRRDSRAAHATRARCEYAHARLGESLPDGARARERNCATITNPSMIAVLLGSALGQ